jgi:hypothetical protein
VKASFVLLAKSEVVFSFILYQELNKRELLARLLLAFMISVMIFIVDLAFLISREVGEKVFKLHEKDSVIFRFMFQLFLKSGCP